MILDCRWDRTDTAIFQSAKKIFKPDRIGQKLLSVGVKELLVSFED